MKLLALAVASLGLAAQVAHAASLKDLVRGSLEQAVGADASVAVEGVNNCENKCQNLLGFLSYYTAEQQQKSGVGNNEYRGCMLGCNQCNVQQQQSLPTNNCFDYCKNYAYAAEVPPIKKGVIEPDKACIIGCVIQLCQGLCTGDGQWTQDGGGCQIQSGYGVQTYNVDPSNNFASCCIGLQNVCTYGGKKQGNPNYNKVVNQAHKGCDGSTIGGVSINSKTSDTQMCVAYSAAIASSECGAP